MAGSFIAVRGRKANLPVRTYNHQAHGTRVPMLIVGFSFSIGRAHISVPSNWLYCSLFVLLLLSIYILSFIEGSLVNLRILLLLTQKAGDICIVFRAIFGTKCCPSLFKSDSQLSVGSSVWFSCGWNDAQTFQIVALSTPAFATRLISVAPPMTCQPFRVPRGNKLASIYFLLQSSRTDNSFYRHQVTRNQKWNSLDFWDESNDVDRVFIRRCLLKFIFWRVPLLLNLILWTLKAFLSHPWPPNSACR